MADMEACGRLVKAVGLDGINSSLADMIVISTHPVQFKSGRDDENVPKEMIR